MLAVFAVEKASAATYDLTFTASGAAISGGIVFDKSATDFSVTSLFSTDLAIEGIFITSQTFISSIMKAEPKNMQCG